MATEPKKVFSGKQLRQIIYKVWCFKDQFHLHEKWLHNDNQCAQNFCCLYSHTEA